MVDWGKPRIAAIGGKASSAMSASLGQTPEKQESSSCSRLFTKAHRPRATSYIAFGTNNVFSFSRAFYQDPKNLALPVPLVKQVKTYPLNGKTGALTNDRRTLVDRIWRPLISQVPLIAQDSR
jgi:hypothetical protein